MKAAQTGDRAAYAELLRLATPLIARIVGPKCNRGLEVDDVVQDVLMALHSVRHTYDCNRPFTPWLASIARHRLVDAYRKRSRVSQNEAAVPELPETFSAAETNWEMSVQGDPELLRRAIADLPAGQRQAVELLKLRELSLKEASKASGMSVAALKVAVHRGLKALRQRLVRKEHKATGRENE
ncbi:MAG: sigma-70 family RNA polymerase sigma factor [Alphaproteobacteria bacterium]|nr:sigma-70 family RNA polymerase sigma factor [Alphaproteobacteria bacterium]